MKWTCHRLLFVCVDRKSERNRGERDRERERKRMKGGRPGAPVFLIVRVKHCYLGKKNCVCVVIEGEAREKKA
jgi:hypothetical protein